MTRPTLKQLRAFEALARHGHFGRAAQACAVTQPALSMQIKALEDRLGTVLFERTAHGVRLTGFGEDLAGRVREILRAVDDLTDLARAAKTTFDARFRVPYVVAGGHRPPSPKPARRIAIVTI
jgi:LysR family hydrogen peroxide-inducible transcriptional activator